VSPEGQGPVRFTIKRYGFRNGKGPADVPRGSSLAADLTGFFARNRPKFEIRQIATSADLGLPKRLQAIEGGIAWSSMKSNRMQMIGPGGFSVVEVVQGIGDFGWEPGQDNLWLVTEDGRRVVRLRAGKPGDHLDGDLKLSVWVREAGHGYFTGPRTNVATPSGHLWSLRPDALVRMELKRLPNRRKEPPSEFLSGRDVPYLPGEILLGASGTLLYWGEKDWGFYFADPKRPQGKTNWFFDQQEYGRAHLGSGDKVWIADAKANRIICLDLQKITRNGGNVRPLIIPLDPRKTGIQDLAEGPDGAIWFTAPLMNCIGRLELNGKQAKINFFPLPIPGSLPAYIINGNDGSMYFTQAGGRRIGAITAVDPLQPVSEAAALASFALPPRVPFRILASNPASRRPAPAEGPAPAAAAAPLVQEPAAVVAGSAAAAAPLVQEPAAAAPEAGPAPLDVLAGWGLAVQWRHVFEQHGYGADNDKGQFLESGNDREAVAKLICQAVEHPTYELMLDTDGRWLALKAFDHPVGYFWDWDARAWALTRNLVVVLSPRQDRVVTTYPVRWF
jgi:hypothetical protein